MPALEEILYEPVPVLDHGFIRVIDYLGDDSRHRPGGPGLLRPWDTGGNAKTAGSSPTVMRHRHTTPFEMCEIKYHVKLPIFVARQWIRHRTASVNEYSARYSVLDREFYVPAPSALAAQSGVNRQGRGAVLQGAEAAHVLAVLRADAERAHDHYRTMLNEDEGRASGSTPTAWVWRGSSPA